MTITAKGYEQLAIDAIRHEELVNAADAALTELCELEEEIANYIPFSTGTTRKVINRLQAALRGVGR